MGLLVITTLLWAASFSLIGKYLAGQVDSWHEFRTNKKTLYF